MYRVKSWRSYGQKQKSKYKNKTCRYKESIYDSKFESKVAQDLDLQVKAGLIKSWDRQLKIPLDIEGHHITNYYIDFVVFHNDGTVEYLEVKGYETEVWRLKWKMFEALYGNIEGVKLTVMKA